MSANEELDRLTTAYREGRLNQDEYALLVSRLAQPDGEVAAPGTQTAPPSAAQLDLASASAGESATKPIWKRTWFVVAAVVVVLFALGEFVVAPGLSQSRDERRAKSMRNRSTRVDDLTPATVPLPVISQAEASQQVHSRSGLPDGVYNDPAMISLFGNICNELEQSARREGMYVASEVMRVQGRLSAVNAPAASSKEDFALNLVTASAQSTCPVWLPPLQDYLSVR